jgi:general secretion pathway protein D
MKIIKKMIMVLAVAAYLTGGLCAQGGPNQLPAGKIVLNFQNASINEVLDYLSETAGLIILSDTSIEGRVNIVSKQPISIDEAISLINTILKENNYSTVRMGKTLKLVKIEDAKHLNIPVTSGSEAEEITASDELITHIIPIHNANAKKLKDDISSLVPSYAVLSSNEASNSLIITDTKANVRKLVQIVQALDTQMAANADVKVFHLVYADAENTATLINDVFDQEKSQSSNTSSNPFSSMRRFGAGGPPMPGMESSTQDSASTSSIKVVAAADDRTNTIVVSGPADTLGVVSKVIKELDSNPDEERTIFVYTLKNAQSDNLKEVLNNLFQEMQQLNEQSSSGSSSGQINRGFTPPGAQQATSSSSSSSSSDISDEVYIEEDNSTNSLLVMTSPKNYEKIKKVIDELDKPVPQVLIKVLLAEVTTSNTLDLGAEFSVLNMRDSGGQTLFKTDFLPDNPTGGMVTKVTEGDLDLTLRALEKVGKLNVLSRPYILTSNNQTAKITVGKEVPFITDTRTTETGQTINTIQYEDIGIILEVTPSINPDGLVIMTVKPEISTTTAETVPISETVDAAVFAKRSSESMVAVKNNQTIVIGGLMQDQETDTIEKVPLIGDIPLIGELFKRTIKEKEKTELLIFLTPQVASENSNLINISEHERSRSKILNNLAENPALKEHVEDMESTAQTE